MQTINYSPYFIFRKYGQNSEILESSPNREQPLPVWWTNNYDKGLPLKQSAWAHFFAILNVQRFHDNNEFLNQMIFWRI